MTETLTDALIWIRSALASIADPLLANPLVPIAFVVGVFASLIVFAILGRAPVRFVLPVMRMFGRLFRAIAQPFGRLSRLFRRGRTSAAEGTTMVERGIGHGTEVDAALRVIDAKEGADERQHDFKEEEGILDRPGRFFTSIRIPQSYLPAHLEGQLTQEITDLYVDEAKKFFGRPIALSANDKSLYEDAEGAFIVSLFRSVDRRCYYVLNEMRKTMNDNARNLAIYFSIVLYVWFGIAFWYLAAAMKNAQAALPTETGAPTFDWWQSPVTLTAALQNLPPWDWQFPVGVVTVSALIAATIMFVAQGNGYRQQQQHNSRELRFFLTKYLGRIADRFREVTGNAKQVTVGKEIDSASLAALAQRWHKIMVWMPFRTFFIECFMRSVIYQIKRNTSYYMLIPYAAVAGLGLATIYLNVNLLKTYGTTFNDPRVVLLYAGTMAMLVALTLYYVDRIGAVVLGEELSRLDWLGYEHLDVSSAMDAVVGKYAEDVGFWKSRMRV